MFIFLTDLSLHYMCILCVYYVYISLMNCMGHSMVSNLDSLHLAVLVPDAM